MQRIARLGHISQNASPLLIPSQRWACHAYHAPSISPPSSPPSSNIGPLEAYHRMINEGAVREDPDQLATLNLLQNLYEQLKTWDPASEAEKRRKKSQSFFSSLFGGGSSGAKSAQKKEYTEVEGEPLFGPKGLYLWGGVGCGKTFMMDMFFECAPSARKRRVHFHSFMLEVHARIHEFRKNGGQGDPIPSLTQRLVDEAPLLCFDEFMVLDIGDAMILKRLFQGLFERGAVVVATSNRPPDDLYKDGLQRESFIPCIRLVKERCIVHNIRSVTDYRLTGSKTSSVYHTPLGAEASHAMQETWNALTSGTPAAPTTVEVLGRKVEVPMAAKGVARFSFDDLCAKPMGASDYIQISKSFHTVFLTDIPRLKVAGDDRSKARRFITLIDELYEHKVKLVCSAEGAPWELFASDSKQAQQQQPQDYLTRAAAKKELHDLSSQTEKGKLSPTTNAAAEELFAFDRTVSRLIEMQSREYLESPHATLGSVANDAKLS